MKKILTTIIVSIFILALASCSSQNKSDNTYQKRLDPALINNPRSADGEQKLEQMPTMDFIDTMHDFGKMYEGEMASYDFKFTNNGQSPLLISNAAGTCGCTVPDYPHEPIAPGASAIIGVKFNSANKVGLQNKSVNIFTNSNKGTHMLNITAEVIEKQK